MGSGKTITSLASALYAIRAQSEYAGQSGVKIVYILPRNLLEKTKADLSKYLSLLKKSGLNEQL